MPSLRITQTTGRPHTVTLFKPITTLGRGAACDITVDDTQVAELHAQLVFDGRDFSIAEAERGSLIFVNDKKKRRSKVYHDDVLKIGSTEMVFSMFDAAMPPRQETASSQSREQDQLVGMQKLMEFNHKLSSLHQVQEQLEALVDSVIGLTNASKGFVILLENDDIKVSVARNITHKNLPNGVQHLSDSILQKVIQTKRPIIISDALRDEVFAKSESVMNLKLSSVMCAPLIAQGKMLGIIYVGNDDVVSLFDNSNLNVFVIFATQAALILQNALLRDQLISDRDQLAEQLEEKKFGDIIGSCPALIEIFQKVEKVAKTDISVLITGETGTGKELIAREIHRRSERAEAPFVVVNCGAIPENLIESELFGHTRGAFTGAVATRDGKFQQANKGTLFLDEIGELPANLQVKLLRALQEKVVTKLGDNKQESVDIRILAATHRDLNQSVQEGSFREDLLYRLNVINLHLPPLRERGDDIVVLARYLLEKYVQEYSRDIKGFAAESLVAIRKYDWPGNVRQLENRIKKSVVLCDSSLIRPSDLDLGDDAVTQVIPLAQAREQFQRKYILDVLERNNGNRTKTAHDLDVDPRTIFRYLEREHDAP